MPQPQGKNAKVEIQVIDDKLLIEGIHTAHSEGPGSSTSNNFAEANLVELAPTTLKLTLSFKNIGRIENLVGFARLEKLCLDNNLIEEIINLGQLKSLKWLDLSFNKIRKIQGIDQLKNLEDLSLYCNKISTIEGLDQCTNLQCLSLGNNRIESLEQVIKLRQIRSLKMLTLANNPVENNPEYRMTVLAYVDSLQYLDYAMIDKADKLAAKEQYHDELVDVEEKEAVANEQVARDKAAGEYFVKLDKACILFASTVFDDLFNDDQDFEKLKILPGVKEISELFRSNFKTLSEEYIGKSLERFEKKQKEMDEFDRIVTQIRRKDDAESTLLLEKFSASKKEVVQSLTAVDSSYSIGETHRMVKKLQEELDRVCDELMGIELRLNEKFDVLVDDFDNRMAEAKNIALESQTVFFRGLEELEEKFSSGVRNVATDLIEKYQREEITEDLLTEDAASLVTDKEVCMGLVSASRDLHIGRILKKEDEARNLEVRRTQDLISGYTSSEQARSRDRVLQIHEFYKSTKGSLAILLASDEEEGGDDADDHHK
jgi:Leucine-rich repeat